jgi:hypothetical protein
MELHTNIAGRTVLMAAAWAIALNPVAHSAGNGGDGSVANPSTQLSRRTNTMNIRLTINGKAINANLITNATAKDFLSLLPMTVTLDDYAATEKITYLPRKLSTADAPAGSDPSVGDLAYYAPWGNLAIFYRDSGYAKGLVPLGRIDSGIEALSVSGSLKATIERVEK